MKWIIIKGNIKEDFWILIIDEKGTRVLGAKIDNKMRILRIYINMRVYE